jgi:hypothetical protein
MHFPTYYTVLQDFDLVNPAPPRVYTYQLAHVVPEWARVEIEIGDMIKYSPTGMAACYADLIEHCRLQDAKSATRTVRAAA